MGADLGASEDGIAPLSTVIDRIGLGPAQLRAGLLGGSVWLADGAELLLIGTVTRAVSEEWHLRAWQRGIVVSVVFVGIFLGNCICGPIGDRYGRRIPIVFSYAGICFFSLLSASTQGCASLCLVRLLVGASFGVGQPAFSALMSEITPSRWRMLSNSCSQALFVVGEMYSALLVWWDDPYMRALDWRWLLVMGSIPSLIMGTFAFCFLHQSPAYLAVQGEYDQAIEVLESMRKDNRVPEPCSVDFTPTHRSHCPNSPGRSRDYRKMIKETLSPVSLIFSPKMRFSTVAVIYSTFTLNMLFYGCLYAFPQVVTDIDFGSTPAMALFVGTIWELPGNAMAVICGMRWPRKRMLAVYLVLTSISLILFTLGAPGKGENLASRILLHCGYVGIKCFGVLGFISVYQYSTEIYPTTARTTGTAACVAGGRLGGILAPLAFEWIQEKTGDFRPFFWLVVGLCIINLFLVALMPFETFGKALANHLDEDEKAAETQPLAAQMPPTPQFGAADRG
mmetsp:Transcript_128717/g.274753  ORF Transcript_128717/g.274753 Transcript_128717/m.274753 type:complete len:508 (+) Transcript_128717:152-1675(+)